MITKWFVLSMVVALGITVASCGKDEKKLAGKIVQKEPVTVMSLDKRVSVLEQRNRDANPVVAKRKAVK